MPSRPSLKRIATDFNQKNKRDVREKEVVKDEVTAPAEEDGPAISPIAMYILMFALLGRYVMACTSAISS
jgi:hypothetical protein